MQHLDQAVWQLNYETNSQFVTRLYDKGLGRFPSPEELSWATGLLNTFQITRTQLAYNSSVSAEFEFNRAPNVRGQLLYYAVMLRAPSQAEVIWIGDVLRGGLPWNSAIANFLAAYEYEVRTPIAALSYSAHRILGPSPLRSPATTIQ